MSTNKRVIDAVNVVYVDKDGKKVELFKGDELPANAPKEIVEALDEQKAERADARRALGLDKPDDDASKS